jgi:hypothetical protein
MRSQSERHDGTPEARPSDHATFVCRPYEEAAVSLSCKKHPDRPARARCVGCGKLLCETCRHKVGRRNFCEACVPGDRRGKKRTKGKSTKKKSAFLAALLSVVPGLGQLYCGRPLRALFLFAAAAWMAHALLPLVPFSVHLAPARFPSAPFAPGGFVEGGFPGGMVPGPSLVAALLPLLALVFLGLCDAVALARRTRRQASGAAAPSRDSKPSKHSFAPDLAFLGLSAAGLGAVIILQNTAAPWLSVTVMWPIALVLFGITVAFSRA